MNLGDLKTRVKRQFGDESGAQITEADIVRWANDGQIDIVRKTEVLQEHRESNLTSGDKSYELPSNFMMMVRVTLDDILLSRTRLEDLDARSRRIDVSGQSGTPTAYYIWNRTLYLYPAPDSSGVGNLDIWYVKTPTELVADEDIPDIPVYMHEDLVRYCIARAKELDADDESSAIIMSDYEQRMHNIRHEVTTPPLDSYPAVRALPGDYGESWY